MILVIGYFLIIFGIGMIIFYTNKIHLLPDESEEQVLRIFKKYPELYTAFKDAELKHRTFPIPGLLKTQTLEKETKNLDDCYDMTPQGLAITEKYLFISAYCYSHEHYSVIFMLDKKEARYLKTIILRDRTHAGGLAYDAIHHCLWVSAVAKDHGRVAAISMDDILNYDMTHDDKPISYRHTVDFPSIYQASFITMNGDSLLAGTFSKRESGAVANVSFVEAETFDVVQEEKEELLVPKKAQGIVFYKDYCLVSQSFGPFQSKIYFFSNKQFSAGALNKNGALQTVKAPPYLEQIAVFGDHLYLIFESGAASYREKTAKFLTEVVAVHLPTLLEVEK